MSGFTDGGSGCSWRAVDGKHYPSRCPACLTPETLRRVKRKRRTKEQAQTASRDRRIALKRMLKDAGAVETKRVVKP